MEHGLWLFEVFSSHVQKKNQSLKGNCSKIINIDTHDFYVAINSSLSLTFSKDSKNWQSLTQLLLVTWLVDEMQ